MLDLVPFDRAISRLYAGEPPDTRRRARLVSSFGLMGVVGGLTLAISHLAWYRIPPAQVVAPALAGLASLAVPLVVLRWKALALAGHLSAACWMTATFWGVYLRGGIGSPPMMTIGAAAFIAGTLVGRRAGLAWAAVVAAAVAGLVALPALGVVLPDLMPEAYRQTSNVLTSGLFSTLLVTMGLAQEWLRAHATQELAESEKRKLRAEREATMARAGHLASLGQLAAGVAHELNNPLMYVHGNLELLGDQPLPEAAREALHDALDGARRLKVIVGDLKAYSRQDDERAPVDLEVVVRAALRMAAANVRRVSVTTEFGPCPQVLASETRLGQVLVNLLVNSVQSEARSIVVRTGTSRQGGALLEVRDTGKGIPAHLLPRVTEPFFTTKPAGLGTGLGLAVCDKLVRELGGSMNLESAVGQGTTVTLVLPPLAIAGPPTLSA
jgi:signal transduction histidine kinase